MASSRRAGRARSPCDRWRRKQAVEQGFSVVGDLTEAILKDRLDVHAFLHSVAAGHALRTALNSWVDAPSDAKRYPVGPKARKSAIYQGLPLASNFS